VQHGLVRCYEFCFGADGAAGIRVAIELGETAGGDLEPYAVVPSFVQTFYELGVRWMLIAYNRSNAAGGGCLEPDAGLTDIGRSIISEMNRVGMLLCLSHIGPVTAAQAIEYSADPVIFSHANPSGDTPHARNISDSLIRACAKTGGVIGLSGVGQYLGANQNLLEPFLRQIRYLLDLVGARHVGIGLDYVFDRKELIDGVNLQPELFTFKIGADDPFEQLAPESFPAIIEALAGENLSDEHIRWILGENWLRVASDVWK
jgi:membrane dipeptidase